MMKQACCHRYHPLRHPCCRWWGVRPTHRSSLALRLTLVTDVYGMKSSAQFHSTLSDNIIDRGTPMKLISYQAQVEISKHVQEILQTLYIASWQSEPHHQHQNPPKCHYQDVKWMCNTIVDHTSAPAYCWLLCLIYICFVLNNCYSDNIKGHLLVMGTTNDISPLLCFKFYKPVYYHMDDIPFPSMSKECCSWWVGISENIGNFMTFKVLADDTLKVMHPSFKYLLGTLSGLKEYVS